MPDGPFHEQHSQELREVREAVQSLRSAQSSAGIRIDQLSDVVRESLAAGEATRQEVAALRKQLADFVKEDRRARTLQFAQTALIDVRAEKERHFGHHKAVRRGVIGMLQALDLDLVTPATVQQVSERLMIDAPEYWLAPVQVTLAAWLRNNPELARKALHEALSRDRHKTALFFSLVLARYQRYEASADWIERYVDGQDCRELSGEFVVVLDAVAVGALGDRALRLVHNRCAQWYQELRSVDTLVREQTDRWRRRIAAERRPLDGRFTVLPGICPSWPDTLRWLEGATVYDGAARMLGDQLEATAVTVPHSDRRRRIDRILNDLIQRYDDDEASVNRREAQWLAIVEHGGDRNAAEAESAVVSRTGSSDFLSLLTSIVLDPRRMNTAPATQRFALALAGEWIEKAVVELAARSRAQRPTGVDVVVDGWSGELRSTDDIDSVASHFTAHVDQEVDVEVRGVGSHRAVIGLAVTVAVVAALFLLGDFSLLKLCLAGFAVLVAGMIVVRSRRTVPHRRNVIRARGEHRKRIGRSTLEAALSETRQLFQLWEAESARESRLVELVRSWAAGPDAGRAALEGAGGGPAEVSYEVGAHPRFARIPEWDPLPPGGGRAG